MTLEHVRARLLAVAAGGAAVLGLLWVPARLALAGRRRTSLDGIVTVEDAVAACRETGLTGWDLVTYAQRLVYAKFAIYSCRNLWDTPARAFEYGMGYCTQYNLALKQILERLGFDVQAVYATRVRVLDEPAWNMGHTWLRVRAGGEVRTACAGRADNLPGRVGFAPRSPVRRGDDFTLLLSHLGMILFCGFIEWRALVKRRPLPPWMYRLRANGRAAE